MQSRNLRFYAVSINCFQQHLLEVSLTVQTNLTARESI